MRRTIGLVLVACVALLLASCSRVDPHQEINTLDKMLADAEAAVKAEDVEAIMAQYSTDPSPMAYFVAETAEGNSTIRAAWEKFFADAEVKDFAFTDKHHKLDRELAVTYGTWSLTLGMGEMDATSEGRYTVVYAKRDGAWKVLHLHVSRPVLPMQPPAAEEEAPAEG